MVGAALGVLLFVQLLAAGFAPTVLAKVKSLGRSLGTMVHGHEAHTKKESSNTSIRIIPQGETFLCAVKGQEPVRDTFCYFWMELGQKGHAFSETGWNGDDDHDSEGYVRENIRSTCSQLPKHLTISGITHIAHELSENYVWYADALYICCKICDEQISKYTLLSYMQRFYLRNYRVTFMAQATPSGNSEKHGGYCLNEYGASLPDFGTHTCFSLVEAHYGSEALYHAGPLLIGRLPQYDPLARKLLSEGVSAEVLTYSKINVRRRSSMRLCRVFHRNITNPVTWSQHNDNFIPDHHCMIVSGPHIYIQFCCCNTNLFDCSMRRGISQGHDEESAEEIICAIGKMNSTGISEHLVDLTTFGGSGVAKYCYARYTYSPKKKPLVVTVEMGKAYGCTYGIGILHSRSCRKRTKICSSDRKFSGADEVIVECCCGEKHLCNHDMMFYNALTLIPSELQQPNCYTESVYRSIFMWSIRSSLDENYQVFCNVHYDYAKKKIVSLLPHNNILLTTAASPRVYYTNGMCAFVEVRISSSVPEACPEDIYDMDDTLIGRIVYVCTCSAARRKGSEPCDRKLAKKTITKAKESASQLPFCYHGHVHHTSFGEAPSGFSLYRSKVVLRRVEETFWCYDSLRVDEHGTAHWHSGEVLEGGYYCEIFNDEVICCCRNRVGRRYPCNGAVSLEYMYMQNLELIPRIREEEIQRLNEPPLRCPTSRTAAQTCTEPLGCYFSRTTDGSRKLKKGLPHGCISNLTPSLLKQYPFLALCRDVVIEKRDERCFGTSKMHRGDWIILCCCKTTSCTSKFLGKKLGYRVKDEL